MQTMQPIQYSNPEQEAQGVKPNENDYVTDSGQTISNETHVREEQFVAMDQQHQQQPIYSNEGVPTELNLNVHEHNQQIISHSDHNTPQNLISPNGVLLQPGKYVYNIYIL